MRSRRALLIVAVLTSTSAAGSLGPLWHAKVDPEPDDDCPKVTATRRALAVHEGNTITLLDRATGARSTLPFSSPRPELGIESLGPGAGDTLVVALEAGITIGVDGKTGALRWQRQHRGLLLASAGDLIDVNRATMQAERFDAKTGATKWRARPASSRDEFNIAVAGTSHTYIVSQDRYPEHGFTITSIDSRGKVAWSIDDTYPFSPRFDTSGDELLGIMNNHVHVYDVASGLLTTWKIEWNATPLVVGDVVYTAPRDEVVAHDATTGVVRWRTSLPAPRQAPAELETIGLAGGILYVMDGPQLRQLDAATGTLLASYGAADLKEATVWDGAPAITMCGKREVVALDPAKPADEHRVKLTGHIRCRNCTKGMKLEVRVGDGVVPLGRDRRFSLEVTARGTLPLEVRQSGSSRPARVTPIAFDTDRDVELGDVDVTVPDKAPGDD
jgi:outer membrane protein assembly factor BamB